MSELGGPTKIQVQPKLTSSAQSGHGAQPDSGLGDKYEDGNTSNGTAGKTVNMV